MNIIQQIDKIREINGINKRNLCRAAEITPEYYSKLVAGKSQASIVIVEKLAKAVGFELRLVFSI